MGSPAALSARAVLLGLFGAGAITAFQVVSKARPQTVALNFPSVFTLFTGVVFYLFLLALLNEALKRWRPRAAFAPGELSVIYGLATVGAAIGAQDEVQYLLPMYVWPLRASQDIDAGPFRPYLPTWIAPRDPEAIRLYYEGHDTFWRPEIWRVWVVPLACWMAWLAALGLVMWSWNVLLRRRWVEHDKLAFPCLQLPLELCRHGGFGGLASGRLFWWGFALAAAIESLNQLSALLPSFPPIRLDYTANDFLDALPSPWKALSPMYLTWGMLHIGVCYLIPTDILFSSWFFYVLRKLGEVWGYSMGWRELGWDARGFPYTRAQASGAWTALFFLLIWAERKHLARVLEAALTFTKARDMDDADEFGSYRTAGRTLVLGSAFLVWWSVQSGMSWGLAVAFYAFFWILSVTMTRIYAQVGPPILELYFIDPQKMFTTVFGSLGQTPESLTQFSLMYWINRDHRGQPMAHQLSAFYLAQRTGVPARALGRWVPVAFVVGCIVCLLTCLHWNYRLGEDQWASGGWKESGSATAIGRIREWIFQPKGPQWTEIGVMAGAAAFTLLLAKLNYAAASLGLHPIGYALAVCFAVEYNWPAFFLAWLTKALLLRYGGLKLYLRLVPFFLGLTLAGFVIPVFWGLAAYGMGWYL